MSKVQSEYFILTNLVELADRAKELGYEDVLVEPVDSYDSKYVDPSYIDYAIRENKSLVRIMYLENEKSHGLMTRGMLKDSGKRGGADLHKVTINLNGATWYEHEIENLSEALEYFPRRKTLEKHLKDDAVINETDYNDRCGNCHSYMKPGEKYCKYCGTERGEGAFEPFKNYSYGVYGPTIKKKYKCSACGHIWIVGILGGDHSKYCPECGKRTVNVIEEKVLDVFTVVGEEEPYDVDEEPRLFSDEQTDQLLKIRDSIPRFGENNDYIEADEILKAMRRVGVATPDTIRDSDYPRTEKEGEQFRLAETILNTTGSKWFGYPEGYCKHCHRDDYIAAIEYGVYGDIGHDLAESVHAPGDECALRYPGKYGGMINYEHYLNSKIKYPAYICLCCGREFGELVIPKEVDKKYRKMKVKSEAEKIGKELCSTGVDISEHAKNAVSSTCKLIKTLLN